MDQIAVDVPACVLRAVEKPIGLACRRLVRGVVRADIQDARAAFASNDLVSALHLKLHLRAKRHETRRARTINDLGDRYPIAASLSQTIVNGSKLRRQCIEDLSPFLGLGCKFGFAS